LCLCKGEPKGHDPESIALNHVKVVGLTHQVIHVVNYAEGVFKGVLISQEVCSRLTHEVVQEKLIRNEEEKRKIAQEQFLLLLENN